MTFIKGQPKPEKAGRKPGTPNKRRSIEDLCLEAGVDPFRVMVDMLQDEDKVLRFQSAKELAQYLEAKKKQLEIALDPDKNKIEIIIKRYGEA